jgi:NADPH:quinone reductase-like Zn-dependent oxidoreductase
MPRQRDGYLLSGVVTFPPGSRAALAEGSGAEKYKTFHPYRKGPSRSGCGRRASRVCAVKALVQTGTGGYEVLQVQERPDPPVGPGEVRIAVRAAGINFADTMARLGLYPDAPKPPCVMGYEVAGVVESVGEGVSAHAVGDRVVAGTRFGGQAELVTVPEAQVLPLAERLSFEQGAAIPVNYGTAYAALIVMGSLRQGNRVLIHAAAGGVGIAATQIARNAGAEIFGTASPGKHEAITAQGVAHPIDYRNRDFEAEIMRITGGEGVDLIIDALGPTSFRKDYRLLRPGGRLVMYGLSEAASESGRDIAAMLKSLAKMPLATIPWWKSLALMNENKGIFGLNMLKWWDREGSLDRVTEPLMADLEAGRLEPVVAEAFPFEHAGEAHRFIAERRNVGKVVLFPQ